MILASREWCVAKPDREAASVMHAAKFSRVISSLLALRGFKTPDDARKFLDCQGEFYDPLLMKDMDKAAARLNEAVQKREKITVYGDYDADGVTATAILYSYLKRRDADVNFYIPNRETEGYGLNDSACGKIADSGTKLLITVDTGISAFDESRLLKKLNVCFIITDHHDPREELPEAYAVVNPKQPDCLYPYKELAGAGVAFKLVCAAEMCRNDGQKADSETLFRRYGEFVCLGTVADVVPLLDENRLIVKRGLELIREGRNVGISSLLEAAGAGGRRITSTLLGFTAAPRINACGRISDASDALELLLTEDPEKAKTIAEKLNKNNTERREIEKQILKETVDKIEGSESLRLSPVMIVSGEKWHIGVIGIVASRLVELYGKPTVVVSFENDTGRASCRSIPGFNIHDALVKCSRYLERFGGHELAAGFTVKRENYDGLYTALNHAASAQEELPTLKVRPDMKLRGYEISLSTAREINLLEPFGNGNPQPLFYIPAAQITAIYTVNEKHTRMMLNCGGFQFSAIMFGTAEKGFDFAVSDIVDIAVLLEVNIYKNKEMLGVIVRDIRKSACFEYYGKLYESFISGKPIMPDAVKEKVKPSRDEFAAVYRLLRQSGGGVSLEYACKKICRAKPKFNYFKLLLIKDVFAEMGLIEVEPGQEGDLNYRMTDGVKADLSESALLKKI